MAKEIKSKLPTKDEAEQFDMLYPMLKADLDEMKELSKKKQDGVLNTFKAKSINKKLSKIKAILANEPTIEFLDLIDEEVLPTNSDAVLVLTQYKTALEHFKKKHSESSENTFDYWTNPSWKTKG